MEISTWIQLYVITQICHRNGGGVGGGGVRGTETRH